MINPICRLIWIDADCVDVIMLFWSLKSQTEGTWLILIDQNLLIATWIPACTPAAHWHVSFAGMAWLLQTSLNLLTSFDYVSLVEDSLRFTQFFTCFQAFFSAITAITQFNKKFNSVGTRLPLGCHSAATRLPLGCHSAATRVSGRLQRLQQRLGLVGKGVGSGGFVSSLTSLTSLTRTKK